MWDRGVESLVGVSDLAYAALVGWLVSTSGCGWLAAVDIGVDGCWLAVWHRDEESILELTSGGGRSEATSGGRGGT
eukprot:2755105-Rhodomonas_salina.1